LEKQGHGNTRNLGFCPNAHAGKKDNEMNSELFKFFLVLSED